MKPESRTILPSPDVLNNLEYGKFVLSNLAAKRAKQIRDGAPPLIRTDSNHPLSIALAEIAAGKIRPVMKSIEDPSLHVADAEVLEEVRPSELGILLPALDETEVELVGAVGLVTDEPEEDHEDGELGTSLTDLLADDEEEEVATTSEESDTLSLNDLAEEEASAVDDEHED